MVGAGGGRVQSSAWTDLTCHRGNEAELATSGIRLFNRTHSQISNDGSDIRHQTANTSPRRALWNLPEGQIIQIELVDTHAPEGVRVGPSRRRP